MIYKKLHIEYKSDTGNYPFDYDIEVVRSNGRWIINITDEDVMEIFGSKGFVSVPNEGYLEWLEDKVEELRNEISKLK